LIGVIGYVQMVSEFLNHF